MGNNHGQKSWRRSSGKIDNSSTYVKYAFSLGKQSRAVSPVETAETQILITDMFTQCGKKTTIDNAEMFHLPNLTFDILIKILYLHMDIAFGYHSVEEDAS